MNYFCSLFAALVLAAAGAGEAAATPLLTPYMVKSSVTYEDGYAMELEVCKDVLCTLKVTAKGLRLRVPKEKLAGIVDPDLGSAVMFVDMTVKKSSVISIEIPYSDFDRKFYPRKKIYVIEIRDGALKGVSEDERPAPK